jgi:4-amino-4-deoxy-L-arabinose transferase-like glycosyltransferase
MRVSQNLLSSVLTLAGLSVFAACKGPDLSLPMFWDELGVYGRGVIYMLDHGPGLLPSSLPPELSRGHPLFFYALFAGLLRLSGYSLEAFHSIALLISLGLIASVFVLGGRHAGPAGGLLAGAVFGMMPQVFAVACLGLPEMLLALLSLWALYAWNQSRALSYFALASLALMTKESALVIPAAAFVSLLWESGSLRSKLRKALWAWTPLISFCLFLFIQRVQNGWFFFPLHQEYISFRAEEITYRLSLLLSHVFVRQGRPVFWLLMLAGFAGVLAKSFWRGTRRKDRLLPAWERLLVIFIAGWSAFAGLNFYMDRYLLALFPPLSLLLASVWHHALPQGRWKAGMLLAIGSLAAVGFLLDWSKPAFAYDQDINYRQYLKVQQEVVNEIASCVENGEPFCASFPLYHCFEDARYGFTDPARRYEARIVPDSSTKVGGLMLPPGDPEQAAYWKQSDLRRGWEEGFFRAYVYCTK